MNDKDGRPPGTWHRFALDEITKSKKPLTPWEASFITDMAAKIQIGFHLTPKQEEVLTKIHKRCTEISRIPRYGGRR